MDLQMVISLRFAPSVMLSSRSMSARLPIVMPWTVSSWFLGSIIVPTAGFISSISRSRFSIHLGSVTFPVSALYCTMSFLLRFSSILLSCASGMSSFLASSLMLQLFSSSTTFKMSNVLSMSLDNEVEALRFWNAKSR